MITITRKAGESLLIGDDIEISVTLIDGDKALIGVNAPSHVQVHRTETYGKVQEENRLAASISTEEFDRIIERYARASQGTSPEA